MQIEKNKVVGIEYTLTDNEGQVLDTSKDREPLFYIHGVGALIPGLEEALEGKDKGHASKVSVKPEKGYGPKQDELIHQVSKTQFQNKKDIAPGMHFQADTPQGAQRFIVTEVEGEMITLDGNHPLAGKTLHFDVEVVEVREATSDELDHGHVHGQGGVEH